ncbi:MAG: hypothetical protein OXI26_11290 [bacterium]|nr:hypothetical protein [bacterium]
MPDARHAASRSGTDSARRGDGDERGIRDTGQWARTVNRRCDERGVYASFLAVIASALMLLGAIAYDGPRLTVARQDAAHAANEAARVAAATIASGGTIDDARNAAEQRLDKSRLIYGQPIAVGDIHCAGSRVQVTVVSNYVYRSALGLARDRQPIEAIGAAEAYVLLPNSYPSDLSFLGECPL